VIGGDAAQAAADVQTIALGHAPVQDRDARRLGVGEQLQGTRAVLHGGHLVAEAFQLLRQQQAGARLVVGDQDLQPRDRSERDRPRQARRRYRG
jgi:hypothetical protein